MTDHIRSRGAYSNCNVYGARGRLLSSLVSVMRFKFRCRDLEVRVFRSGAAGLIDGEPKVRASDAAEALKQLIALTASNTSKFDRIESAAECISSVAPKADTNSPVRRASLVTAAATGCAK